MTTLDLLTHEPRTAMKAINQETDGGRATLFGGLESGEARYRQAILKHIFLIGNETLRAEIAQRAETFLYDTTATDADRTAALQGLNIISGDPMLYYEFALKDGSAALRTDALIKIIARTGSGKPKPTAPVFSLVQSLLKADPDQQVRDFAALAIAALEPAQFATLAEDVSVVETYRRLNKHAEGDAYASSLANQIREEADGIALLDWFEQDPPNMFTKLNLNGKLLRLVGQSKSGSALAQRYEAYMLRDWLNETGFDANATWGTAVRAIAEGKRGFSEMAMWFAGRGMSDRIEKLRTDALAEAAPPIDARIKTSYDDMMRRLEEMRNR